MFRLLIFVSLILIGGFGIAYLHSYPNSYLLVTFGRTSVETSIGVALVLVVLVVLVLWVVAGLLRGIIAFPSGLWHGWQWWRKSHRKKRLNELTLSLVSGEYNNTNKLVKDLTDQELGSFERLAVTVHAKLARGHHVAALSVLDQLDAEAKTTEQRKLAMRLRGECWLKGGEYDRLVKLELPARMQRQPFWREAIATAALSTGEWNLLLRQLKVSSNLPKRFWKEILEHVEHEKVDKVWSSMPNTLKNQLSLTRIYLQRLIAADRIVAAQNVLVDASLNPNLFALLHLLGSFPLQQPTKLLEKLEKNYRNFCRRQPEQKHAADVFALGLGKLCLMLDLPGKAEDYLAPLVHHDDPTIASQASLSMAQLLAGREDFALAVEHIKTVNVSGTPLSLTRLTDTSDHS